MQLPNYPRRKNKFAETAHAMRQPPAPPSRESSRRRSDFGLGRAGASSDSSVRLEHHALLLRNDQHVLLATVKCSHTTCVKLAFECPRGMRTFMA